MLGLELARIGLEAGPLSQWLYAGMAPGGLAVERLGEAGAGNRTERRAGAAADVDAGVGAIVALTYVAAVDDPTRFKTSKVLKDPEGAQRSRRCSSFCDEHLRGG